MQARAAHLPHGHSGAIAAVLLVAGYGQLNWPLLRKMMLVLAVMYLILGCFLDALAIMIATIPIVWPIVQLLGDDSGWFGIFLVLMWKLALITPPAGLNLYIVQSVRGRGDVGIVIAGMLPFMACILVLVALIVVFPGFNIG